MECWVVYYILWNVGLFIYYSLWNVGFFKLYFGECFWVVFFVAFLVVGRTGMLLFYLFILVINVLRFLVQKGNELKSFLLTTETRLRLDMINISCNLRKTER